jgi:CBS domain-containing protein
VFSLFSVLQIPLKFCEIIGVKVEDFQKKTSASLDRQAGLKSGSDSGSDSDDDSHSSSDSDRSKGKRRQSSFALRKKSIRVPALNPNLTNRKKTVPLFPSAPPLAKNGKANRRSPSPPPTVPSKGQRPLQTALRPTGPVQRGRFGRFQGRKVGNVKKVVQEVVVSDEPSAEEAARLAAKEHSQRLNTWLKEVGAVFSTDPMYAALEAMSRLNSTRAIVVQEDGDVIGVVSIKGIAKFLLEKEAEQKLYIRKQQEEQDGDFYVEDLS